MRDEGKYKLDLESQAKTSGNSRKPELYRRMSLRLFFGNKRSYIHVGWSHY
jgi:hypothetical protein